MQICLPTTALLGLKSQDNVGHLYTIPVEWDYVMDVYSGGTSIPYATAKKVTKLMCICGEVKEL